MAEPLLHIRDGYYFEIPKVLWSPYKQLTDVPEWLRNPPPRPAEELKQLKGTLPDTKSLTLDDWNRELAGKLIIPQPFGKPYNLYEPGTGFCISRFMIVELVVAALLVIFFVRVARAVRSGDRPKGRLANFFEAFLEYLRDHVAKPAIGEHDADRFVPLLWTIFFFVLGMNLMGLVPWVGNPTGEWSVTLVMALITFFTVLGAGMARFGPVGFWLNQVPSMDLPWWLWFLKPVIWAIEIFGLLIKHAILSIRLLANMVAGHLVLLGILGLIVTAGAAVTGAADYPQFTIAAVIGVVGSAAFTLLELFVSFLQAYIFTFLSALFIGAAIHHH